MRSAPDGFALDVTAAWVERHSIRALAGRIGMAPSSVSRFLSGRMRLEPATAQAMAHVVAPGDVERFVADTCAVDAVPIQLDREAEAYARFTGALRLRADLELPAAAAEMERVAGALDPAHPLVTAADLARLDVLLAAGELATARHLLELLQRTGGEARDPYSRGRLRLLALSHELERGEVEQAVRGLAELRDELDGGLLHACDELLAECHLQAVERRLWQHPVAVTEVRRRLEAAEAALDRCQAGATGDVAQALLTLTRARARRLRFEVDSDDEAYRAAAALRGQVADYFRGHPSDRRAALLDLETGLALRLTNEESRARQATRRALTGFAAVQHGPGLRGCLWVLGDTCDSALEQLQHYVCARLASPNRRNLAARTLTELTAEAARRVRLGRPGRLAEALREACAAAAARERPYAYLPAFVHPPEVDRALRAALG
ncbi:MAG TPA: hypothetical protein VOB72_26295 [Candidatus Dormibacteraeota bacterium]|nr:hypothetical protein [Candidatus Dormibacteraeota bacterium]